MNVINVSDGGQVFGWDFLLDEEFRVWLIEVNTNPCLALR